MAVLALQPPTASAGATMPLHTEVAALRGMVFQVNAGSPDFALAALISAAIRSIDSGVM